MTFVSTWILTRTSLVLLSEKVEFTISGPTNARHQLHVDKEYNWSGQQNPEDAFQIVEKIGQG
jgi:hypothetical protein